MLATGLGIGILNKQEFGKSSVTGFYVYLPQQIYKHQMVSTIHIRLYSQITHVHLEIAIHNNREKHIKTYPAMRIVRSLRYLVGTEVLGNFTNIHSRSGILNAQPAV